MRSQLAPFRSATSRCIEATIIDHRDDNNKQQFSQEASGITSMDFVLAFGLSVLSVLVYCRNNRKAAKYSIAEAGQAETPPIFCPFANYIDYGSYYIPVPKGVHRLFPLSIIESL